MNSDHVPRPRVSVGMPIYNGAKTLAAAIESLTNQTYRDIEIIISNNGSTDETAVICEKYAAMDSRIHYFKQDKTLCPTKNFNFVVEKSRGESLCGQPMTIRAILILLRNCSLGWIRIRVPFSPSAISFNTPRASLHRSTLI